MQNVNFSKIANTFCNVSTANYVHVKQSCFIFPKNVEPQLFW